MENRDAWRCVHRAMIVERGGARYGRDGAHPEIRFFSARRFIAKLGARLFLLADNQLLTITNVHASSQSSLSTR